MIVYNTVDGPMIEVVLDMEPVSIDTEKWLELVERLDVKGKELEKELGVNVYSPKQVIAWFRDKGIDIEDTTAETLSELGDVAEGIILARMYRKATSTYGKSWIEKYAEDDGGSRLVYSAWHISGATSTGRMSSSNPNLQQIPARKIPEYREMFISRHGLMIDTDVSAQEPHILAWHSKDKKLLQVS